MEITLSGKRALVTGAGSGIGRAIALTLAEAGADVAVNDRERTAGIEETGARIRALGRRVLILPADVSDATQVEGLLKEVARGFGGLDLHVNNAGIMVRAPLLETTAAEWQRLIGVNLTGYFLCGTAAARLMLQNEGRPRGAILNVCSPTQERPPADQRAYGITKSGVHAFTRALAAELAPQGIRVNAVEPGATPTGINVGVPWRAAAGEANQTDRSASGRYAWPEDIARAAVFLLSDAAAHVSGADLRIDGGLSLA